MWKSDVHNIGKYREAFDYDIHERNNEIDSQNYFTLRKTIGKKSKIHFTILKIGK